MGESILSFYYYVKTHTLQGGVSTVNGTLFDDVSNATFNFQQNVKDPKAQIIPSYNFFAGVVRKVIQP